MYLLVLVKVARYLTSKFIYFEQAPAKLCCFGGQSL
jgi:hypothetical protein